jgi:hypothetical protein
MNKGRSGTAYYSLGQYNEIVVAVLRALPKALEGTDPKLVIKILQKKGSSLECALKEFVTSEIRSIETENQYTVMLNGFWTTEDLLGLGEYGYVNENINSVDLPRSESKKITMKFFKLDHDINSTDVAIELDKIGYRTATAYELLSFASTTSNRGDLYKFTLLIALGSVWPDGNCDYILALEQRNTKTDAILLDNGRIWAKGTWFAAVSK